MTIEKGIADITFTVYRRHSKDCNYSKDGRRHFGCRCPIWGDGYLYSERILRKSLGTKDAAIANARMAKLIEICSRAIEQSGHVQDSSSTDVPIALDFPTLSSPSANPDQNNPKARPDDPTFVKNAADAFLANCKTNGVKEPTIRKYRNSLRLLTAFAADNNISCVGDMKVIDLDRFRASKGIATITSLKELETMRQFWSYCVARDLCTNNIAKKIKGPTIGSPNDVEPYSVSEVDQIIAATQTFGRSQYERARAKAIILVLRYTALRIGDVAVLRHDHITMENGRWLIFLRATKNNKPVFLPIPSQMKEALDAVPVARKATPGCPYYFWSGTTKVKSIVSVVGECVSAVFKKSGVPKAHAHRFRHTLATELLGAGASFEEVADILGDSVEVINKHYAKWSLARQARVSDLMVRVHGDVDWSGRYSAQDGETEGSNRT
ncbi:MAG: tyrosine-type recombinase/integrase [Acidobacteriaceae bacterium]